MKHAITVFALSAISLFSTQVSAEMLYQYTFTKDGKVSMENAGKAGGKAVAKEFKGQKVDFAKDAPVADNFSCDFKLQPKRQRGPRIELENSAKILRCSKVGDKITLMTWVKWRGYTRPSGVASNCPDDQKSGWALRIMPDGKLNFSAMGGFGHRTSKEAVEKDKWVHIAFSWEVGESKGLKFYINGKDAGINLSYIGTAPVKSNDNLIRVGVQTPKSYLPLNGAIYDFRIYDEIVPVEKIAEICKGAAK